MDPIKNEKLQAMNRYKKTHFLQTLFQYFITVLVLSMGFSKVSWIPSSLFSSMKIFFSVSLPNIGAFIVDPKCLFVVCNVIVIFLISESKLSCPSSPSPDIYDEYVRRSQSLRRQSTIREEKEKRLEVCSNIGDEEIVKHVIVEENQKEKGEEKEEEEEEEKKEKGGEEEEEEEKKEEGEIGTEADELYKRVEDFISRVKKERMLEASLLLCSG